MTRIYKFILTLVCLLSVFPLSAAETNTPAPKAEKAPAVSANTNVAPESNANLSTAALPNIGGITPNIQLDPAPPLGQMPNPGTLTNKQSLSEIELLKKYQMQLDLAREQRAQKSPAMATQTLTAVIKSADVPKEIRRQSMFELALVAQDDGNYIRAQQVFGQYMQLYPDDLSTPEVMLRQGLIYRQMGVNSLAISKFYAVMYSALKLKLENMDYYKNIVLQSQVEIADTYYLEGKYDEATDFFNRLIKSANPNLNLVLTHYKLIRSLSYTTNTLETIAQAQSFLNSDTNATEVPEVRFLLATALKHLGRNNDSMKQVLLLLQSQAGNFSKNRETWIYWQQRAGNEIANQLYKEGDYMNALQIYLSLASLDPSPAWQVPVWYQAGLIYEQLQQWQKAGDLYMKIMDRKKELTEANTPPSLASLLDMAKWRKEYIEWMQRAKVTQLNYTLSQITNSPTSNQMKR